MNDIEKQILENELALALDAAEKGDKARLECGAMEMEIKNLKSEITRLESEAMYGAAAFQAAKDEIKKLKDERDSHQRLCILEMEKRNLLHNLLETYRKDAERYRFLRSDESNGKVDLCVTKAYWYENCRYVVLVNEGADWAIDAAMQENKE